ncbi:uncharacterized protein LOC143893777 [Temnothorax americanus]|uniref:uncharacterized protein LOC143893777 n=1 Tax=Temnothorax americanus TaxID=1964332 RepID=UPI004067CC75
MQSAKISNEIPMEVSLETSGREGDVVVGAERALTDSESTGPTSKETANTAGSLRKNRSGAMRRKARKERKKAQADLPSTSEPSAAFPKTPSGGPRGHSGNKRRMGSNETPPSAERAKKKQRAQETGTYACVADPLTKVIVAEGYPEAVLTAERLALLKGAVSKEIESDPGGSVLRFHGTYLKTGAAIVRCADAVTLKWLEDRIGVIVPWKGARLKVVGPEVLQKQYRAVVWVPGPPEDSAATLARLERQNPGLCTAGWRIFAENVGATGDGRNLVLGLPESSVLKLRTLDFKPYLGIDQVTFKMNGMSQEGGATGKGKPNPKVESK